jgi:SAM-dependent methyltransferase
VQEPVDGGRRAPACAYDASYGFYQQVGRAPRWSSAWWAAKFYTRLLHRRQPAGRVLDFGCGMGNLLRELERLYETWGVDVSWHGVQTARQNAPRSRVWVGDTSSLAVTGSGTFDAVIAKHVLEHVPQPAAAIQALAGALRPGGTFIMAVPNTTSLLRGWKGEQWIGAKDPTHCSLFPPQYWTDAARQAGMTVEQVFSDGFWDVPYVPVVPALLQLPLFGCLAIAQVLVGRPFVPVRLGESFILIARKRSSSPPAPYACSV